MYMPIWSNLFCKNGFSKQDKRNLHSFGASSSFAPSNEYHLEEIIIPGHMWYQTSQFTGLCGKTLKK